MKPFEPDGLYAGMPYRVLADNSIEVLMPSGLVKFKTLDRLLATLGTVSSDESLNSLTADPSLLDNRGGAHLPAQPLDYYSILKEAIHTAQTNSAQLRALVYEKARFNFKRDILFGHPSLGLTDLVRHVNDFELAVARIEAKADLDESRQSRLNHRIEKIEFKSGIEGVRADVDDRPVVPLVEPVAMAETIQEDGPAPTTNIQVLPPRKHFVLQDSLAPIQLRNFPYDRLESELSYYKRLANEKFAILLFTVVFLGAVTILGSIQWFPARTRPETLPTPAVIKTAAPPPSVTATATVPTKPAFPLPVSFGVYALDDNKLVELPLLQMSVPDSRIALSAEIKDPSSKVVSSGKPAFILFRRDFRNNVPQKLSLRIVARMARETKIVDGKPIIKTIEDGPWRIRNIARDLTITPIADQPEMLIARLDEGASLSPGRYVLVLNRTGYDFTVAGQINSSEFCLEGFETTNGSVLTQCRIPAGSTHKPTTSRAKSDG